MEDGHDEGIGFSGWCFVIGGLLASILIALLLKLEDGSLTWTY